MATKTINLTGAEVAVTGLDGAHAHIRNDGTEVIYAAKTAGITAGADGVLSIPAGQSAVIYGISGVVYVLGTGSALIISSDYNDNPFKTSAASGGSGADEVARTAINTHAGNDEIHVTAEEKAAWNAVNYSNPNLLINPDFRINQRGLSEYASDYTVDRWALDPNRCLASVGTDGISLTSDKDISTNTHMFLQWLEFPLPPGKYTLSVNVKEVTGVWRARIRTVTADGTFASSYYTPAFSTGVNKVSADLPENEYISAVSVGVNEGTKKGDSVNMEWMKLELGSVATPFTPPDPATELAKCQRYYQIRTTNDIDPLDLRPSMRDTPTITQLSDGNYAYSAEL